jgi:disulfide bond formation protein DsbB
MSKRLAIIVIAGAMVLTACGGSDSGDSDDSGSTETTIATIGDPVRGEELYGATCTTCHGPAGEGIEGLGKPMPGSVFIAGETDDGLIAFIKVGRPTSHPDNTTGVDMPPKGGNPALSDEDIVDIVAYIRTIN